MTTPTPHKVLFLTHNYPRYKGDFAGVFLHLLARKLREHDIEIIVVAPHDKNAAEYEILDGIKIHRFRYAKDEQETLAYRGNMHRQVLSNPFKIFDLLKFINSGAKKASEIIEKENINTVSVHWVVPGGLIAKKLLRRFKGKIRLILSSHGTDVRLINRFYFLYLFLKRAIKTAEKWSVVSQFTKRLILERDINLSDKIEIIPMPSDETIFYPDGNILEDPNLIVAASRLTKQKRLDYLFRAMPLILKEIPNAKLEIYGEGPERESLLALADSLSIMERTKVLPPVTHPELRKVYNRAAVVVLNSVDEGFGLSLVEAMLCRRAVIGTESGGIVDIIDINKTGLLVDPDNVEALAESLKQLLKDSSLRTRLSEAGYQKALAQFSTKAITARYAALLKDL